MSTTNGLTLTGIVGSLRRASVNGAFARAATARTPENVSLTIHGVDDLPFYNGDVETAGLPGSVDDLHAVVDASDGVIFFSPVYNGSFPAVTKNAIDWLSRPPKKWEGVAMTMVTASPGRRAGLGVRDHFTAIMERQPVRLFETLGVGASGDKLDQHGALADPATLDALDDFVARFADFARRG